MRIKQLKKRLCAVGMMIAVAGVSLPAAIGMLPAESAFAAGDVEINASNFPDENFRKYVAEHFDIDGSGKLSEGEIKACTVIFCPEMKIKYLTGVKFFTALEYLDCGDNSLSNLDLSKNTALKYLDCSENNLKSLDISSNTALEELRCRNNNLSDLDVSSNTVLNVLNCIGNHLSSIDLSKNTRLVVLYCSGNNLSDLDVNKNTALMSLDCSENNLNSLDVSSNTALNSLIVELNNIDSLDVSKNTALEWLNCNGNNLSSLDVSKNTVLSWLYCENNNLSSIDISKNTELYGLDCAGNHLSSIDVSKNIILDTLYCSENNLSSLDVSSNTALLQFSCGGNSLTCLDLSKNAELAWLDCNSQVRKVTASNNEIILTDINPSIRAENISNVKGAVLSGNIFTNITGDTVTYDYGTGYSEYGDVVTMNVTLNIEKDVAPESVSLDEKLLVLGKGKTDRLTASVKPDNAFDKNVTWSSSNPGAVRVYNNGIITAVDHGTAKITAKTVNGKTAECEVRVNFMDVTNAKDWYYKPVYWAAENGITTGTDGKFFPASSCTREQAVTFLWRMAGKPEPKSMVSKYSDVKDTKRYSYKAIMWGTEKGVITGTDGKFYPTGTCTREQIVTMIWRLAGKPEPKNMNSKFKDVTSKTRYSYKAVMWAAEKGITTGTNGLFYPTGQCKRREIVTFIYRYKN